MTFEEALQKMVERWPEKFKTSNTKVIVNVNDLKMRIFKLKIRSTKMRNALRECQRLIELMPDGIDYDAEPENQEPDDSFAHIGGLIYQIIDSTLSEEAIENQE